TSPRVTQVASKSSGQHRQARTEKRKREGPSSTAPCLARPRYHHHHHHHATRTVCVNPKDIRSWLPLSFPTTGRNVRFGRGFQFRPSPHARHCSHGRNSMNCEELSRARRKSLT